MLRLKTYYPCSTSRGALAIKGVKTLVSEAQPSFQNKEPSYLAFKLLERRRASSSHILLHSSRVPSILVASVSPHGVHCNQMVQNTFVVHERRVPTEITLRTPLEV